MESVSVLKLHGGKNIRSCLILEEEIPRRQDALLKRKTGDIRLETINLLTIILEHDRNLDPFDCQDIEMIINRLQKSMEQDIAGRS